VKVIGLDCRLAGKARNAGIARYTESLADYLTRKDRCFQFVFLCTRSMATDRLPVREGCRILYSAAGHYSVSEQLRLPLELSRASLSLMHFTHFNRPLLCPVPSVVNLHDFTLLRHPARKKASLPKRWAYRFVLRESCRRSRAVLCLSQYVAEEAERILGIPRQKIHLIPAGISPLFRPMHGEPDVQTTCQHYDLKQGFLLYVGQWRRHKNLATLLQSYGMLVERRGDAIPTLVLAGGDKDDPSYAYLRDILERKNLTSRVRSLGFVPDEHLVCLYNAASVCVYPSLSEGQGLPPLEAMACGTPVAASNAAAIPETVGDAALLFDPLSASEIAESIERILVDKDLSEKLRKKGPDRAALFTWDECADKICKLYGEVLDST